MSLEPQTPMTTLARRKRLKIGIACQACRSKKIKCDGLRPACSNCQKRCQGRPVCTYASGASDAGLSASEPPPVTTGGRDGEVGHCSLSLGVTQAGKFGKGSSDQNGYLLGPQASTLSVAQESRAPESYYGGSPRAFAGEVNAAVHARSGTPLGGALSLNPMTDAPLFGSLSHQHLSNNENEVESVLPPRRRADHLLDIYLRRIQPLEPILDEAHFVQLYQATFAGSLPEDKEERTFLACLNTVFALATQAEETLQPEQREKASSTYFHRAWTLLRPETIIWEPGSLAVVQCLLLMSRYLQCTNNPHQTWMAIGSAVRIAQSLDIHMHYSSSSSSPRPDAQRWQHLWKCCVFINRSISWAQGRTSTVLLSDCNTLVEPTHDGDYFTKVLELYEIVYHITLSQMLSTNTFEGSLGLPQLYEKKDYYSNVVRFEACIEKWQKALPKTLTPDFGPANRDTPLNRQRTILHLRLLHTRIVLFRPLLARFCLSQNSESQEESGCQLRHSLVKDAASLCIQAAQHMIDVVVESTKSDIIGILPWWNRISYLHMAGTILVAAMLREDLWTTTTKQYWEITMSAFRALEHLSPFIKQCVENFQTLSSKVLETHRSRVCVPLDGTYFQDLFEDIGFDADDYLFGKEDMSWLGNLETFQ